MMTTISVLMGQGFKADGRSSRMDLDRGNHSRSGRLLSYLSLFFLLAIPQVGLCDLEPSLQDLLTVYFITDIQGAGQVQVRKEGEAQWAQAKLGSRLEEGDRILVGEETQVVLSLRNETLVYLDEDSEMTVESLQENDQQGFVSRLKLWTGDLLADVKKDLEATHSTFEVGSSGIVCGVRGTVFEVSSHGGNVQTAVHEGVVHVQGGKFSRDCPAGQTCGAAHGKFKGLFKSAPECSRRYEAWKNIRGRFHGLGPGQRPKGGAFLPHSGLRPNGTAREADGRKLPTRGALSRAAHQGGKSSGKPRPPAAPLAPKGH